MTLTISISGDAKDEDHARRFARAIQDACRAHREGGGTVTGSFYYGHGETTVQLDLSKDADQSGADQARATPPPTGNETTATTSSAAAGTTTTTPAGSPATKTTSPTRTEPAKR